MFQGPAIAQPKCSRTRSSNEVSRDKDSSWNRLVLRFRAGSAPEIALRLHRYCEEDAVDVLARV